LVEKYKNCRWQLMCTAGRKTAEIIMRDLDVSYVPMILGQCDWQLIHLLLEMKTLSLPSNGGTMTLML